MNKSYTRIGAVIGILTLIGLGSIIVFLPPKTPETTSEVREKVYVALEGEGKIAVINTKDNSVIRSIDLTQEHGGDITRYMAHNVQVTPDGTSVLVTANIADGDMEHGGEESMADMDDHGENLDELIVIDPRTDIITRRIPVESDSHLAHVVAKGTTAFVALQEKGMVYAVDIQTGEILRKTNLGEGSGPHGLRLTPDGSEAFIALLDGKGVARLNTATGEAETTQLPGAVVQTAVTPDGAYAFASLYDTKEVAWFDLQSGGQGSIALPTDSRGPVQLYPTPDSRYLYVVDQGYYFEEPTGTLVYRIAIADKSVDASIVAGSAPHGVVVARDGTRAYVTNLLSNDVSVIDTTSNKEIARIPVGTMPNGISVWNAEFGGTP